MADELRPPRSKTQIKREAQDALMGGIANILGYYDPHQYGGNHTPQEIAMLQAEMKKQADRVAKLLGYDEAWSN